MKRIGILGLLLMSLMLTCCMARADGGNVYAVVHNPDAADRLNLRAAPNKKAESLGKYYNGVEVQILEELNNGWVRVRIGNRGVAEGYMMKAYLQCDNTQTVAAAMPTYTSTSSAWELYQSRDVNGAYDMQGYGETVTLLGFTSKWWHVQIRGYTGFVPADGSALDQRTGNYYDGYATAQVHNPISTDRLNLRAEKTANSASLGKYYNGCTVAIVQKGNDGWSKVRIGNLEGYMKNQFLDFNAPKDQQTEMLPKVTIQNPNGQGANLRRQASTRVNAVALYPNGTRVQVLGIAGEWCHVLIDGEIGFMMTQYLVPRLSFESTR